MPRWRVGGTPTLRKRLTGALYTMLRRAKPGFLREIN